MYHFIAALFSLLFLALCAWLALIGYSVGAGFAGVAAFVFAARASGVDVEAG